MKRRWIIVFGDLISFIIAFGLLVFIRFEPETYMNAIEQHAVPFFILYLFWVLIFYIFGLYDLVTIKPTIPYLKRWVWAIFSSFIIGLLLFYFVPVFGISPKLNLFIQVSLFGLFSFIFRRIIYMLFSSTITQPVILVGSSSYLLLLKSVLSENPQIGLKILGHFEEIEKMDSGLFFNNTLIILDKNNSFKDIDIFNLHKKRVEIIDTAKAYEKYLFKIPVEYVDISFVVENLKTKNNALYDILTLTLNTIFSLFILIITSPILLISALFIYIEDKGPIFYKQDRVGLNGKNFNLYKLRSMTIDAEKNGAVWSTGANDMRVTRIGKTLRKLHIDEIPQMINILKGDLSLVGPRPERPEFVAQLESIIPHYKFRHVIRPGFTGWAQIKYRYADSIESSKEKFEYDLYYIKNRNIFIDIGIIIRTIQIIFTH